ncbi:MAG: sensor histidine kinase [Lachnospiraceae bacterium]|nr:sensor histidine kinase [Lachnospiraceae bacterium]
MRWYRNASMNKKLGHIVVVAILPMALMLLYLLWALSNATNAYTDINKNVAYANQYVRDFKERTDYTVYLAIIKNKRFDQMNLGEVTVNGIVTVNPYRYIKEFEKACADLSASATVENNEGQLVRLKNSLLSLNVCIRDIEKNIIAGGHYDENMKILRNDVYALTKIIQEGIQEYIYVETTNFVNVKSDLDRQNERLVGLSMIAMVAVLILSGTMAFRAARSVSVPIRKLCQMTSKVAEGDFTVQGEVESGDEISVLTRNFNNMTTEIGLLVEDIKKNQENLRMIEVRLLQAQINPHFLYNTLDTIVWLAEAGKKEEVVSMVTYLSDFFRTTLSGGRDIITVADDKRHIESYLKIQKFRYQDVLDYEIHIQEEILGIQVPKLMLQPLVENALGHGIRNKRGKGKIEIIGERVGEDIIFKVIDDGRGMSRDELFRLLQSMEDNKNTTSENGGFGIVNVNQRIRNYYGERYGVTFESVLGEGTTATVRIPARTQGNA